MRDTKDRERVLLVDVSTALNSALAVGMVEEFANRFIDPPGKIQFGTPQLRKVNLNAGPVLLTPNVLTKIRQTLRNAGFSIDTVYSKVPQTQMAALDEGYFVRDSLMHEAAQEVSDMFKGLGEDPAQNEALLKDRLREKMASLDAVLDARRPVSRPPEPETVTGYQSPEQRQLWDALADYSKPSNSSTLGSSAAATPASGTTSYSTESYGYSQPSAYRQAEVNLPHMNGPQINGYVASAQTEKYESQYSPDAYPTEQPEMAHSDYGNLANKPVAPVSRPAQERPVQEGYAPSRLMDRLQEIQTLETELRQAEQKQEKTAATNPIPKTGLGVQASLTVHEPPQREPEVAKVPTNAAPTAVDLPPGVVNQHNTLKAPDGQAVDLPYIVQPKATVPTLLVKQNLRSGQMLRYDGHIVILGDVHAGAEINATGDVVVWGELKGIAHAGSRGNARAEVRALRIEAIQLRIADFIARRPDRIYYHKDQLEALRSGEVARVADGEIKIFQDLISR